MVKYLASDAASVHRLVEDREIPLCLCSLFLDARRRSEELAAWIARLEAPERVAALLVDLYDRLRRRRLVARGHTTCTWHSSKSAITLALQAQPSTACSAGWPGKTSLW
jgi:hypothetical protein